ncbi:subtilisin-like serine protease [Mortierella sp. GBAus27b]|nr:hypothetical protein BGX31_008048 [Mortierella sp. GBA43]KAI8353095.1 subtilisin-like serine protease [Mortierella sp. GBAus27b]
MKVIALFAAVLAVAQAAPLINSGGKAIADSYIVVLKDGNTADSFQAKFDDIAKRQNGRGRKPSIHRKYTNIPGFAATVNDAALKEILAADEVAYVEQDAEITLSGSQASPPSWGLPRVSQRDLNINAPYLYHDAAGSGVTAYVVDTGIRVTHTDFGGRAKFGASFISGQTTDGNGHGTHVAGTIGGTKYGVAKNVTLVAVKVLSDSGSGATSGVVAGMDWVVKNAKGKSVVNMSLGGGVSTAINDAAQRLYQANIPLIVAAGNSASTDACNGSPSGAANTYTVAASDSSDNTASFTSYGSCVEIFGPGVGITSAWYTSDTATNSISGTSMASPHVAGVAALYLSNQNLPTAQAVFDKLTNSATLNKIKGSLKGSPNRLVFNGAGGL